MDKTELKRIRLELGLSQSVFARHLNTSRSTYLNWEHGYRRIPGILEVALRAVRMELKKEGKKGGDGSTTVVVPKKGEK